MTVSHCIPLTLMAMLVGEGLEGRTSVDLPRSREDWREMQDGKHVGINAD